MAHVKLGRVAGLELTAGYSAVITFPILWAALAAAGAYFIHLTPLEALLGGLAATLLNYLSELWHQLGHARAARRTGYPMKGVRFWLFLGGSIYPKDEGDLPAEVHVRRALGGVPFSLAASLVFALLAALLGPARGVGGWVALFASAENLLVYTIGALLPLGFTDGSTLLHWLPRR